MLLSAAPPPAPAPLPDVLAAPHLVLAPVRLGRSPLVAGSEPALRVEEVLHRSDRSCVLAVAPLHHPEPRPRWALKLKLRPLPALEGPLVLDELPAPPALPPVPPALASGVLVESLAQGSTTPLHPLLSPSALTQLGLDPGKSLDFELLALAPGFPLSRLETPLAPQRLITILAALSDALERVLAEGFTHGDIKLSNVVWDPDSAAVMLVDRELIAPVGTPALGENSLLWATPAFAAPELFTGAPRTGASEIFALGVCAARLLGISLPSTSQILTQLSQPVPPAQARMIGLAGTRLPAWVPAPLNELVASALAPDPQARPTPAELAAAARAAS